MGEQKTISGRAIVVFLVVLLAIGMAFYWNNRREQEQNVDSYVEQLDN